MIFTFYSYKGGVGRSMALANIAESFYQQGARVLMIDWDLEAPGLESFFYQSEVDLDAIRSQPGLIDLLIEYRKQNAVLARTAENGDEESVCAAAISKIKPFAEWLCAIHGADPSDGSRGKGLWLLTAGARHGRFGEYAEAVHDFNWAELYNDYQGERFFEWLRQQAAPTFEGHQLVRQGWADVVLIDSRTGITEMGGVCTQELADVVVAFTAPNEQNLASIETMANSFRRPEILEARNNKPEVIIVPSRVDASEIESRNRFEKRLRKIEGKFIPPMLQSLQRSFWDLKIPYVPRFAYEEALTIRDASGKARYIEAGEMTTAYRQLAATLAVLTPTSHPLRQYTIQDTATLFERKRVYLTWAGAAGTALAHSLRLKIEAEAPDIDLWLQQRDSAVPVSEAQVAETIVASSALLLALTPEAPGSEWVRSNWQQARRSGTCVTVVYSGALRPGLPVWMRKAPVFELTKDWAMLLQNLRSRCTALRAPFMAPDLPAAYVRQKEQLELLLSQVITPGRNPQPGRCVLQGMGGSGKSILAAALCHEQVVIDAYVDGILWVSLGQKPDIRERLTELYVALTGERKAFTSQQQASFELGAKVTGLNCLIVLDDVWRAEDLQWVLKIGRTWTFITTTRDAALSSDAFTIRLSEMTMEEAIRLLNYGVNMSDLSPLEEAADRLGRLPLGLSLARAVLLERIRQGESPERAGEYLNRALSRSGLENFKELGEVLERSLAQLPTELRQRFYRLAGFPASASVAVASAATLWGIEEIEAETQIQNLARLSLLEYDPRHRTFLLHPALKGYIETLVPASDILGPVKEFVSGVVTLISVEARREVYRVTIESGGSSNNVRSVNRKLVIELTSQLLQRERAVDQIALARTLCKLLVPVKVPPEMPVVVRAQGEAVLIPWEMLIPPEEMLPLGIEPGLTRISQTALTPAKTREESGQRLPSALIVVGGSVPGQQDALLACEVLMRVGWKVIRVSDDGANASAVISAIASDSYDVIHFGGVQLAGAAEPAESGWVFGELTLTVRDMSELVTGPPALVFSDCIPSQPDGASMLAEGLMSIGVSNFVGPSAGLSDLRAKLFAPRVYGELVEGSAMYIAMARARRYMLTTVESIPRGGVYQHYGNPFFRLPKRLKAESVKSH